MRDCRRSIPSKQTLDLRVNGLYTAAVRPTPHRAVSSWEALTERGPGRRRAGSAIKRATARPRPARRNAPRTDLAVKQAFYRLADERREIILVACSKCDWRAAFSRDDLIASHGADYPMPNLLDHLAAPSCSRLGSNWDRCGVHYVEPIETDGRGE